MRIIRTISLVSFLGLVSLLTSCGEAATGFKAPYGSTVKSPAAVTVPVATGGIVMSRFTAILPNLQPANDVQMTFVCSQCLIWDSDPVGGAGLVVDTGDLQQIGDIWRVKTGSDGSYTIWASVTGGTAKTATVTADIIVATGQSTINVK